MLLDIVKKGSTDRSVKLKIIDSAAGTPETGVVYNTSGIDLWYRREGGLKVSITEADLATPSLDDPHLDGGFLHISDGDYRLDSPDAAFATGANYVDFGGTVTGMVVLGGRVRLVDFDLEAATVTLKSGTHTGAVIPTVSVLTGHTPQTGNSYPIVNSGTHGNAALKTLMDTTGVVLTASERTTFGAVLEAMMLDEGDATALLAAISAKVETFLINEGDATATLAAIASAVWSHATRVLTANTNLNDLDAAAIRAALGLASANLDTQLGDLPTAIQNADELLKRDWNSVTGEADRSVLNALRILRNRWIEAAGNLTVFEEDDTTVAWTSVLTASAGADPITESNPA